MKAGNDNHARGKANGYGVRNKADKITRAAKSEDDKYDTRHNSGKYKSLKAVCGNNTRNDGRKSGGRS